MAAAKAALTLLLRALRLNEMVNACVTRPVSHRYSSGEGIPTTELIPNKQTTTTTKKKEPNVSKQPMTEIITWSNK